jgi:hypothetical protein
MKSKAAIRIAAACATFLLILALRVLNGGQTWAYVEGHLGLTVLLPLVAVFFGLLARRLYLEYGQASEKAPGHEGMASTKI